MKSRHVIIAIGVAALVVAGPLGAQESKAPACAGCHDQGKKLHLSAHAALACTECHVKHEQYPHPPDIPKPVCASCHAREAQDYSQSVHGQAAKSGNASAPDCSACHGSAHEVVSTASTEFRKTVPDTCGMCHADIAEQYRASVHGKAVARGAIEAPVCTTCHGEHAILGPQNAASPVHSTNVPRTCAQCHANVELDKRFGLPPDRVLSFQTSIHGLALKAGSETVANCDSCHGVHNILPSSDPKSTINPKNLATTCGKCHLGAGTRYALGSIHELPGNGEPRAVGWVRAFYMVTIPLTIGLMLLHNLGDWVRKLIQRRVRWSTAAESLARSGFHSYEPRELRMLPFERVQHALLLLSFIVLAWTGFALKYPDGWWARPLLIWEDGLQPRGLLHRIAAVVFMLVAAVHLVSLIVSGKLRDHWKSLWPVISDAREGLLNFAYNLGLSRARPKLSSHGYVEKVEYWAVVWGAVIMSLTGVMLWATKFMLHWVPKSILDVATAIHFYEAVLAVLAILVWHFYTVIFDPDVYPMETAWLTGRSVKRKTMEESEALGNPSADPTGRARPPEGVAVGSGSRQNPAGNDAAKKESSNEPSGH